MKDLLLLVADKNMQFALKGALPRSASLEIRAIEFDFIVHSGRDGGVRKTGSDLLCLERSQYSHGLLVLDFEGCGTDHVTALDLEAELNDRLRPLWNGQARAIVIDPELDIWMWGGDYAVQQVIGWPRPERLRDWLIAEGFEVQPNGKPVRPKEALEAALRVARQPRSSAVYQAIASTISLSRCDDAAFDRLRAILKGWFPTGP